MNEVRHDQAGIGHQLRDFGDAADVLDAVGGGEAEILVEAMTHVVAVEQRRYARLARAACCSTILAMVDLPAPDRPVNQRIAGFWSFIAACASRVDGEAVAMHVGGAAQADASTTPAAAVSLVRRSIRMKAPMSRFCA